MAPYLDFIFTGNSPSCSSFGLHIKQCPTAFALFYPLPLIRDYVVHEWPLIKSIQRFNEFFCTIFYLLIFFSRRKFSEFMGELLELWPIKQCLTAFARYCVTKTFTIPTRLVHNELGLASAASKGLRTI